MMRTIGAISDTHGLLRPQALAALAAILGICASFQGDNLRRHFTVRVSHAQPRSRVSMGHVLRVCWPVPLCLDRRSRRSGTPRRPIGAGGVRGASRSGSASVITTHALFARKVQRKLSNGVAGFAAAGSSSDRKRSPPIRAFSATPH
jgi:hypothetical protein